MNDMTSSPRLFVDVTSAAPRVGNIVQGDRHQLVADSGLTKTFFHSKNILISGFSVASPEEVQCPDLCKSIDKIKNDISAPVISTPGTHVFSGWQNALDVFSTSSPGENQYRNGFHFAANEAWSITFSTKYWPLPCDVVDSSQSNIGVVDVPQLDAGLRTPESNASAKVEPIDGKTGPKKHGARLKVESGLLAHFGFEAGAITKFEPIRVRKLARDLDVSRARCSEILREIFLKDVKGRNVDDQIAHLLKNNRPGLAKILARLGRLKAGPMNFEFFGLDPNKIVDERTNPPRKHSIEDESQDHDETDEHLNYYIWDDDESEDQGGEDDSAE